MGRVEKKMYRRARGQALLRKALALGILVLIGLGAVIRLRGMDELEAQHVPQPTPTPVASAYDETVETREVTLPAESWYAIQTGIYSTAQAAQEKRDAYAQRGAPGYVNQDGEKWRVYIACYGDKDDAAAVRERLSVNQGVETYLHSWVCPEITLRLTGMVGQLDVVETGLTLMHQAANVLRDNAALLDSGERTLGEARSVVAALDESIRLWQDTAGDRFTRPYPELVEMEMQLAAGWKAKHAALQETESATALSAAMKLQAMALYDESCALRQALME
ncbi:MAG: SPOR domain-containing protein [Clostridia bacterium]|nr:SPOR domain-containing protein [Clostridia bacterium]